MLAIAACACLSQARAAAAPAGVAAMLDRLQVESMLIASGYSGVATLRLVRSRWVGTGAHDGVVVAFAVDAATGRLVSEVEAR